ncbi:hypothetical protein [Stutzerimonas nitrititolerans]|uniref:hypothetical protein n=1 Tax=Stutzerimonas nitrititolerans TaxID=2482751 RepID=UPI0028966FC9|nr:hypothetical protein [Stutzerimonas nitrititolerans]
MRIVVRDENSSIINELNYTCFGSPWQSLAVVIFGSVDCLWITLLVSRAEAEIHWGALLARPVLLSGVSSLAFMLRHSLPAVLIVGGWSGADTQAFIPTGSRRSHA